MKKLTLTILMILGILGAPAGSFAQETANPAQPETLVQPYYNVDPGTRPGSITPKYNTDPGTRPGSIIGTLGDPGTRPGSVD